MQWLQNDFQNVDFPLHFLRNFACVKNCSFSFAFGAAAAEIFWARGKALAGLNNSRVQAKSSHAVTLLGDLVQSIWYSL